MRLTIFMVILLLSTVVRKTDSCSSFRGWKSRHDDDSQNNKQLETQKIEEKMTETTKNNNNLINNQEMNENPALWILPIGAVKEQCTPSFEEEFCSGHGRCVIIDYKSPNKTREAQCFCYNGYEGPRCMQKVPDGSYRTVNGPTETPESTTMSAPQAESTTNTIFDDIKLAMAMGQAVGCPTPWKENYCVYGECFMIPSLSTEDHFCSCYLDYTGDRCTVKALDYQHVAASPHRQRRELRDRRVRNPRLYLRSRKRP